MGTPMKPQGVIFTSGKTNNTLDTSINTTNSKKFLKRQKSCSNMEIPITPENTLKPFLRSRTTFDTDILLQSSGKPVTSPWSAPSRLVSSLNFTPPWSTNNANNNQVGGSRSSTKWFVPSDSSLDTGNLSDTALTDGASPSGSPSSRRVKKKVLNRHLSMPPILRKKGAGSEGVSGGSVRREGGSSSRRRSPLAARKSTGGLDAGASQYTPNNNSNHVTNSISNTPAASTGSGLPGSSTPQQSRSRLSSGVHADDPAGTHSSNEEFDAGETVPSSGVSNGSGELVETLAQDDADGHVPNIQRTREALEHTQAKIQKTKDLIKEEQKARDENVNEYLKLAANADRQQLARIKAVFEKKNQKSAAYILQLQKKLENYQRRLREIETHGVVAAHRQPKEVLRDMGQGLKTVINKPKEIAHLIKNKFGSADNIRELPTEDDEERTHHGSATLPPGAVLMPPTTNNSHNTSANLGGGQQHNTPSGGGGGAGGSSSGHGHGSKVGSEEGSDCGNSSVTSESIGANNNCTSPRNHQYNPMVDHGSYYDTHILLADLQETRAESRLLREEVETIKQTLNAEVVALRESLAEERFRCERLEEQVNDLTELHQNEMENLKTTMTDMEEKVQYQSEERIRDLHEIVENCHTRISRMEHQQAQQQQQFLTLEGLENTNARAVFVKLINILLTVLQVLLLIVATVASILTPLLQTRTRIATTATLIFTVLFVYIQVPELRDWLLQWCVRFYNLFSFNNG